MPPGRLVSQPSEDGVDSGVGTPVIVEGRLWGVMSTHVPLGQPLPADTEARLASFTELVATAIANAESRAELSRLAEEQAALRRVATWWRVERRRRSCSRRVHDRAVEEDVHAGAVGNHVEAALDRLRIVKGRDPTETYLFHDTSDGPQFGR
jgi:hypothetical protein